MKKNQPAQPSLHETSEQSHLERIRKMQVVQNNNKKLSHAASEGNLIEVRRLTTDPELTGLIQIDGSFNYALRVACIKGYLDIVEFLLNHPDPAQKQLVHKGVSSTMAYSIENAQPHVFLYLKDNYPVHFEQFISTDNQNQLNSIFDVLTMRGELQAIQTLEKEVSIDFPYHNVLFFDKAMHYNQLDVFEHWLKKCNPASTFSNCEDAEKLVHCALYHQRFDMLEQLIEKFNFDLSALITPNSIRILVETHSDSISHIIEKYHYQPPEGLMTQILDKVSSTRQNDFFYTQWHNFVNHLQTQKEKNNLSAEISASKSPPPSSHKI